MSEFFDRMFWKFVVAILVALVIWSIAGPVLGFMGDLVPDEAPDIPWEYVVAILVAIGAVALIFFVVRWLRNNWNDINFDELYVKGTELVFLAVFVLAIILAAFWELAWVFAALAALVYIVVDGWGFSPEGLTRGEITSSIMVNIALFCYIGLLGAWIYWDAAPDWVRVFLTLGALALLAADFVRDLEIAAEAEEDEDAGLAGVTPDDAGDDTGAEDEES